LIFLFCFIPRWFAMAGFGQLPFPDG